MKGALGSSLLLYIVVFFVTVIILFFAGIMAYTKAYKVKNRIVELIEKYDGYDSDVEGIISDDLVTMGYTSSNDLCNSSTIKNYLKNIVKSGKSVTNLNTSDFGYCVYELNNETSNGRLTNTSLFTEQRYYLVITFVHFDIPIIGSALNIPVYSTTKVLGRSYNN